VTVIDKDIVNLIFTGVGGQGNVLMSRLVGRVFLKKGYFVTITDDIGVSQRSGAVQSVLRVSKKSGYGPIIPEGHGHVIVGLEPLETLRRLIKYGNPDIFAITNFRPLLPAGVLLRRDEYPDYDELRKVIQELTQKVWFVDATRIAIDIGNSVVANVAMIGSLVATRLLPLEVQDIENEIRESISTKMIEANLKAFYKGIESLVP
jgi:indolepyruvate ferredoxin oxidoreductase beta subunit